MKGAGYKTLKRRRKENKTDYHKRLKLLKGDTPRIVFRRTNKYIIAQYVKSKEAQDKAEFGVSSKVLLKYGWPKDRGRSLKSTPAAYLTGYLVGKKIKEKKMEKPIIDFGMIRVLHKNKTYAFIKGLIDAGLDISCKKEDFPDEDRIEGRHLKNKIPFQEILNRISSSMKSGKQDFIDKEIKSEIEKIQNER